MKDPSTNANNTSTPWRRSCAASALLALLALALLTCCGCDDSIRQTIRQGAYSVFETGAQTYFSELSTGVVDQLQNLADSDTAGTTGDGG